MRRIPIYCLLLLLLCQQYGCSVFEKAGKKLGDGLGQSTKTIGGNLVAGAQGQLTDSLFQVKLRQMLDSVIGSSGTKAAITLGSLRDSLLNDKWRVFVRQLADELTGTATNSNVAALVETAAGESSRKKIRLLVSDLLNTAFSDNTHAQIEKIREELLGVKMKENIGLIRDELLNEKTNMAIKSIVDTAMMTIAYRMNHDVKDAVGENASFIQKYAGKLLMTAGAIALIIIFFVWRNRQKYLKLVTLLTSQINNIPDKNVYDDLTNRIKDRAVQSGVEPTLRKVLAENGILDSSPVKQ